MTDIAGKCFLQVYTHNLKVVGSNPTPATNKNNVLAAFTGGFFCVFPQIFRNQIKFKCHCELPQKT